MCGPVPALGPRAGTLPPDQERQFQTFMAFDPSVRDWRNKFAQQYGEAPAIDGGDYNYREAWQAGARPEAVPGDLVPHWSSVGKAENHPTMWKQHFMDRFGSDPDEQAHAGLSPMQSAFINDQLRRDMIAGDVRRVMGR